MTKWELLRQARCYPVWHRSHAGQLQTFKIDRRLNGKPRKQAMMRCKNLIYGFTFFAASLFCCGSFATSTNAPRLGIFVYSNFCTSSESGDLYGVRVTIRSFKDGEMLIYEYTDGSTHAQLAEDIERDESSRTLRFKVANPDGGRAHLTGQFSTDGRELRLSGLLFEDPKSVFVLRRTTSFSSPIPACR